jgi:serine/threonine kinase 32
MSLLRSSRFLTATPISDIKPDNILLDAMGHAHLTDFNVAIHYSERRLHTSVAGSMAYMAPEIVGKKGYTWCCDFWSLGVTAFELLFSKRPFDGKTAERLTQAILRDAIPFPDDMHATCSPDGVHFLKLVSLVPSWLCCVVWVHIFMLVTPLS